MSRSSFTDKCKDNAELADDGTMVKMGSVLKKGVFFFLSVDETVKCSTGAPETCKATETQETHQRRYLRRKTDFAISIQLESYGVGVLPTEN